MLNADSLPRLIVVMGVAGSGKSSIASLLSIRLNVEMIEADDYHSSEAIALMQKGMPLNDAIREPWIERLLIAVNQHLDLGRSVVMAYSGLKHSQRQRFNQLNSRTIYLQLEVAIDELQSRLTDRKSHFFPVSLLKSQFDAFEPLQDNENEYVIDANCGLIDIVDKCLTCIESDRGSHVS